MCNVRLYVCEVVHADLYTLCAGLCQRFVNEFYDQASKQNIKQIGLCGACIAQHNTQMHHAISI